MWHTTGYRLLTLQDMTWSMIKRLYFLACRDRRPLSGLFMLWWLMIGSSGCASHRPAHLQVERPAHASLSRDVDGAQSLRRLSYNIWGLPGWMTGARSGRYPRIARELERLDPDIVLLQEAWTAKARKCAPANGTWWIARPDGQHTFFQQSGLMTLSKFPIIGGEFYPFSQAAFPDRVVCK